MEDSRIRHWFTFLLIVACSHFLLSAKTTVPNESTSRHAFAKLINSDHEIARYLNWLFIERGVSFGQTYPLSLEEVRYLLRTRIDKRGLSSGGQRLWEEVWALTEAPATWGDKGRWAAIDPVIKVDLTGYLQPERSTRDWYSSYSEKRPSFLDLGMEFSLFDHAYTEVTFKIRPDRLYQASTPNTWGNTLTLTSGLDMMFPQVAYASVSYPHFNIQGGRNRLNWGNGRTGNLLLSEAPEELNYLQTSTWWKFIRFTALWTFLDNMPFERVDPLDPTSAPQYFDVNGTRYLKALTPSRVQPSKFFLSHRLDLALGPRMNLSFSEAVLYQDYWQNAGFLNPLFLFHNSYIKHHSDYFLSIEADIALMPTWTLYAQFMLDQVAAGANRKSPAAMLYPGSLPLLVGTEVLTPLSRGYLNWNFEFVKIDPYSYLHRGSVGLFVDQRWLTSSQGLAIYLLDRRPLGYYLGNDLLRLWTKLKWEEPFFYALWLESSVLFKGEKDLFTSWSGAPGAKEEQAASGQIKTQIMTGIGGELSLARWLHSAQLKLKSELVVLNTHFKGNWDWDVQYAFGITYAY